MHYLAASQGSPKQGVTEESKKFFLIRNCFFNHAFHALHFTLDILFVNGNFLSFGGPARRHPLESLQMLMCNCPAFYA